MSIQIYRKPGYLNTEAGDIFYWQHHVERVNSSKLAVVICPPLGHEYMSSYRTLRELADSFAKSGLPAFRFDYSNTGNSSGDNSSHFDISLCIKNIIEICQFVRRQNSFEHIVCIGLGLGATFSALAAEEENIIDSLIMWEPCIKGKRYLRGLKVLSGVTSQTSADDIDAAGLILNSSLENELAALDATSINFNNVKNILWLYRDDQKINTSFEGKLSSHTGCIQIESFSGYVDMLADPTDTVIPIQAIQQQIEFVSQFISTKPSGVLDDVKLNTSSTPKLSTDTFTEHPTYFGSKKSLFGIMTKSLIPAKSSLPTVLFLNCGSEHHVGPHRMYTNFARRLAKIGVNSFRIDIEGIGDSPSTGGNTENFPYSPVALLDIKEALTHLKQEGYCEFILTGVCAGAYHSFKASAELDEFNIRQAILINPLVFDWKQGDAEEKSRSIKRQEDINRYKKSFFNLNIWKKVFTLDFDVENLMKNIWFGIFLKNAKIILNFNKSKKNIVEVRLEKHIDSKRKIAIIQAESDPGYDLLVNDAARLTKTCIQRNILNVNYIADADHGFSKKKMREDLYYLFKKEIGA